MLVSSPSINKAYRFAIGAAIVFFLALNGIVLYANYLQYQVVKSDQKRYQSLEAVNEVLHTNFDLTKMARLYAATGQEKYKRYFYDILSIRDGKRPRPENYSPFYWDYVLAGKIPHQASGEQVSLQDKLERLGFNQFEMSLLNQAKQQTNHLIGLEEQAFSLIDNSTANDVQHPENLDLLTKALQIIHGNEFLRAKADLLEPLEQIQLAVQIRTAHDFSFLQIRQQYLLYFFQGIILLALFLCIMAYRYVSRQVIVPIRALYSQAKEIGMGHYGIRNRISSHNELEELGHAFNEMCDYVEHDIEALEQLNQRLNESEERFRNAVENAPIGKLMQAIHGEFLLANPALCDLLDYQQEELKCLAPNQLIHPDDQYQQKIMEQKLARKEIQHFQHEIRLLDKQNRPIWVLLSASLLDKSSTMPSCFIIQVQNITTRKRQERDMELLNEKMSLALKKLKKREHENELLNKMNEMLLTCQSAEEAYTIIALNSIELFPGFSGGLAIYHEELDKLQVVRQWGEHQLFKDALQAEDCWALRHGQLYAVSDAAKSMICSHYTSEFNGSYMDLPLIVRGEIIGLMMFNRDNPVRIDTPYQQLAVTFSEYIKLALANINLRDALREQAMRDVLTGLFNRRYLEETLPREIDQALRKKQVFSVVMLDIDDFKDINDQYGHDAGDEILKFIGSCLQQRSRGGDIACRLGGDEFVLVLLGADGEDTIKKIEDIRVQVKKTKLYFEGKILPQITLSSGIATVPSHGENMDTILSAADDALYAAKDSGKDGTKTVDCDKHLKTFKHRNATKQ